MVLLLYPPSSATPSLIPFIYIPIWYYFYKSRNLKEPEVVKNLHSNMVLLLCSYVDRAQFIVKKFTFQYGTTFMVLLILLFLVKE